MTENIYKFLDPVVPPSENRPSTLEGLGAAYRTVNPEVSLYYDAQEAEREVIGRGRRNRPIFKPKTPLPDDFLDTLEPEYRPYAEQFRHAWTLEDANRIKRNLDQEFEDQEILDRMSPVGRFAAETLAASTSVTGLFGGAAGAGAKTFLGAATRGAVVDASLNAAVLEQTQATRTAGDAAFDIAVSGVLGAGFGVAGQRLFGNAEGRYQTTMLDGTVVRADSQEALDKMVENLSPQPVADDVVGGVGAEVVQLEAPRINSTQQGIIDATFRWLSPNIRIAKAASAAARRIGFNLSDNDFDIENFEAAGIGQSVELEAKALEDKFLGVARRATLEEGRKSGLGKYEFRERVGRALRRGDVDPDGDEAVTRAAQRLRADVIEPLKKEAIRLGLLPEDVEARFAESYLTRSWNVGKLIQERNLFIEKTKAWFKSEIANGRTYQQMTRFRAQSEDAISMQRRKQEIIDRVRIQEPDFDFSEENILALINSAEAPAPDKPQSLRSFVVKIGGISSNDPSVNDLPEYRRPGFVTSNGIALDKVREAAWEQGYIDADGDMNDFIALLEDDYYLPNDAAALEAIENRDIARSDLDRLGISDEDVRVLREEFSYTDEVEAPETFDEQDIEGLAEQTAVDIYNRLTGSALEDEAAEEIAKLDLNGTTIAPLTRGPLKGRTFSVMDTDFEEFLDDDAEYVLSKYIRTMTAESALTERFGRADMRDQIAEVTADYDRLLRSTEDGSSERAKLQAEKQKIISTLTMLRDQVRGTHLSDQHQARYASAIRVMKTYNFVRALGGVVFSAIPDTAKMTMAHGMEAVTGAGVQALSTGLKNLTPRQMGEVKNFIKDNAEAAGILEVLLNTRAAQYSDLDNKFRQVGPVEEFADAMGRIGSLASGMNHWNQIMKEWAVGMYINRIDRISRDGATKGDEQYLRTLKLSKSDIEAIGSQLKEHRTTHGKLVDPGTNSWTDARAKKAFLLAMRQDADSLIVTPTIGSKVGLVGGADFTHPIYAMALQFKNFWISSHQRTMIRFAGSPDRARVAAGVTQGVALGMLAFSIKSFQSGRELPDNPGTWLAEGIDRSGMLPFYMEMNNIVERAGLPGGYRILGELGMMAGGEDRPKTASRFQTRSKAGAALGPTAGAIADAGQVISDVAGSIDPRRDGVTPSTITAAKRLTPFANHSPVKEVLNWAIVPWLQEGVE